MEEKALISSINTRVVIVQIIRNRSTITKAYMENRNPRCKWLGPQRETRARRSSITQAADSNPGGIALDR